VEEENMRAEVSGMASWDMALYLGLEEARNILDCIKLFLANI
jgi:hypothetical protein